MKKVISSLGSSILSREQMKAVVGGLGDCSHLAEVGCGGECTLSNGNTGTCGWTIVPTGHCTCGGSGDEESGG